MITLIAISFILMVAENWCYQQHEHLKFNYKGSFWDKLDQKLMRPWFRNNSRPDWRAKYNYIPFIWDGYHFFSWIMKMFYYFSFAIWMIPDLHWGILPITIVYMFLSYTQNQITYRWTFK